MRPFSCGLDVSRVAVCIPTLRDESPPRICNAQCMARFGNATCSSNRILQCFTRRVFCGNFEQTSLHTMVDAPGSVLNFTEASWPRGMSCLVLAVFGQRGYTHCFSGSSSKDHF